MKETMNANARAVLDMLRAGESHPTALEVYEAVRRVRPRIGLATVYRILHQLAEQGLIRELGQDSECRYDARTNRHDHAICTVCGALLDVPVEIRLPAAALQAAAQAAGITLGTHEVRIYGACRSCQPVDHIQTRFDERKREVTDEYR
jgi:Fe2+ or Zn2+ uptake regulation protein